MTHSLPLALRLTFPTVEAILAIEVDDQRSSLKLEYLDVYVLARAV
jgi:hypothetical protein